MDFNTFPPNHQSNTQPLFAFGFSHLASHSDTALSFSSTYRRPPDQPHPPSTSTAVIPATDRATLSPPSMWLLRHHSFSILPPIRSRRRQPGGPV